MTRCALFLAPGPLSTFVVAIIVAAADAQLAFATTSAVSHFTAEPHAMPPFVCVGSLLYGIPQQTFPDAYSI